MKISIDKDFILDAIVGGVSPARDEEFGVFCGNQWNENWKWNKSKLAKMSTQELYSFYLERKIKKLKD